MRALLSVSIDRYTYLTHICCQAPCHRQYSTVYTHSLPSGERCVLTLCVADGSAWSCRRHAFVSLVERQSLLFHRQQMAQAVEAREQLRKGRKRKEKGKKE